MADQNKLTVFVMEEAEKQMTISDDNVESEKLQNFYSDALSSIKKTTSLWTLFKKSADIFGQYRFLGSQTYNDTLKQISYLPKIDNSLNICLVYCKVTYQTIVNMLWIFSQNCVYTPMMIPETQMYNYSSICDNMKVEVKQYVTYKGMLIQKEYKNKRVKLDNYSNYCMECLGIQSHHCLLCAFWCKLAIKQKQCNIDWFLFNEMCHFITKNSQPDFKIELSDHYLLKITVSCLTFECNHNNSNDLHSTTRDNIAYMISTSGTTGIPKIVHVPNTCIVPNILHFHHIMKLTPTDSILLCAPLTFDPSIIEIFTAVTAGASLVVISEHDKMDFTKLYDHMMKVSVIMCTPSLFNTLPPQYQSSVLYRNDNLKLLALGGEVFPIAIFREHFTKIPPKNHVRIFNLYGVTEQSCWSFVHEVPHSVFLDLSEATEFKIPIGVPLWETLYKIEHGELFLGGNRKCFIKNNNNHYSKEETWVATGDKAYVKSGEVFITGRLHMEQKKINGKKFNIELVKCMIRKHLGCECCVTFDSNLVTLFLVSGTKYKRDLTEISELQIRSKLWMCLPDHYKFDIIRIIPKLPITHHHKLDSSDLKIKHFPIELNKSNIETCIKYFLEVRGYDNMQSHKNLFLIKLGLDSIDIMQLANYLLNNLSHLSDRIDDYKLYETLLHIPLGQIYGNLSDILPATEKTVVSPEKSGDCKFTVVSKTNMNLCVDSSPVLFHLNNTACFCVGCHSGKVLCSSVYPTREIWRCNLPDRVESSPCYLNHYIYVGCYDSKIYVLSAYDGMICYTVATEDQVKCSPKADIDIVFCGSHDGCLYRICLDEKTFNFKKCVLAKDNKKPLSASPLILDETVVACNLGGLVVSVCKNTMTIEWQSVLQDPIFSTPAVNGDVLYIASVRGDIITLSVGDGTFLSKTTVNTLIYSNLTYHNGCLFVSCHGSRLDCYETIPELSLKWQCTSDTDIRTTPHIVQNQFIVCVSTEGCVLVVNINGGAVLARFTLPGQVFSTPSVHVDTSGVWYVVLGCRDNNVYVLRFVV